MLQSSGISWKLEALIVTYSQKKDEFLLFSIVLRILQLLITLEPLDQFQVGSSAECTSPDEDFNQIDFRLIALDRITCVSYLSVHITKIFYLVCLLFYKKVEANEE